MDSSPVTPPYVGKPLRLRPFRGLMLAANRVGDPASARAFARPYRAVTDRLLGWERAGHVRHDPTPALYLHEYTSGGLTVRGLVGVLDLSHRATDPADRAVLPHEGVHLDQAVELADRMAEMKMNPAPILLAHHGPREVRELMASVRLREPWASFTDKQEHRNTLWAIRDSDELTLVNEALASSVALIADGHHRYAAYLSLHERHGGAPWDGGLAMLVDQDDTPLFLGPIHREVVGPRLETLLTAARSLGARVEPGDRVTCVARLGQQTIVATDGESWASLALDLDENQGAVEWLDRSLLASLPRLPQAIHYHHSVETTLAAVDTRARPRNVPTTRPRGSRRGRRQSGRVALLMPAPDFDLIARVAAAGGLLPQKATSFQPKPGLGVLMRSVRDEES